MGDGHGVTEWQRRSDESVAREAASVDADGTSGAEFAAMEASGCLPGCAASIALGLTVAFTFIRRAVRHPRGRSKSE